MALDRRRFLQISALGVVAAAADAGCARRDNTTLDRPQLLSMLGPDRVRQLGEHYRAATPREATADALRSALNPRGFHLFSNSIGEQIEDDFENGRTVVLDGWVLAVTEARQAALFSLARA